MRSNLFIIGFMGTGKSVVGREVARALGMTFLDSDKVIERNEGKSIAEIFKECGETHFRNLERLFIQNLTEGQNCVISCGGGLPIPDGMLELLTDKGLVIALFASPQTVFDRTKHRSHRPILQGSDAEKRQIIGDLLKKREPTYGKASLAINTDQCSVEETSRRIIRLYRQQISRDSL